jgi:hypothetical protein
MVKTLARAVDSKDAYTHDHSDRASVKARRLAAELQLPEQTARYVEYAALFQFLLHCDAFDVLHDEVVDPVALAHVDRLHDVAAGELCRKPGFALESVDELAVLGESGCKHLDRDQPVHADLPGLVDDAHRALADAFEELEAGDLVRGSGRGLEHSPRLVGRDRLLGDHDLYQRFSLRPVGLLTADRLARSRLVARGEPVAQHPTHEVVVRELTLLNRWVGGVHAQVRIPPAHAI